MKQFSFIFFLLLSILKLEAADSAASPLCQETVARFSHQSDFDAAHQVYHFLSDISPTEPGMTNRSSDETILLGPQIIAADGLNKKLNSRLAFIYDRIASTPFGIPNRVIQSVEVNLKTSKLAALTRSELLREFRPKNIKLNGPAIIATAAGIFLLSSENTRAGGGILLGLLYGVPLFHLGSLYIRDGDQQLLHTVKADHRLRDISEQLNKGNWVHVGINSGSAQNFIPSISENGLYDFPAFNSAQNNGKTMQTVIQNNLGVLIPELRLALQDLQKSLNPTGTATLDLFIKKTGMFSFKVTAILTADR